MKSNLFAAVILLIGLAAAALAANGLYDWKIAQSPHEARTPTNFYAGMDKFLSNVSWMTLVQWQGDATQRRMTPELARSLYNRFNALTNLDPLFADAYLNGALALAPHDADLSVQLLEKGITMGADHGWKIPFYAGHIRSRTGGDAREAERYYRMAIQDETAPDFVFTALVRSRCAAAGDQPVVSARIWHEYYQTLPPQQLSQRRTAAAQIRACAADAVSDFERRLQMTTDDAARQTILDDQKWLNGVIAEIDAQLPDSAPEPREEAIEAPASAPSI